MRGPDDGVGWAVGKFRVSGRRETRDRKSAEQAAPAKVGRDPGALEPTVPRRAGWGHSLSRARKQACPHRPLGPSDRLPGPPAGRGARPAHRAGLRPGRPNPRHREYGGSVNPVGDRHRPRAAPVAGPSPSGSRGVENELGGRSPSRAPRPSARSAGVTRPGFPVASAFGRTSGRAGPSPRKVKRGRLSYNRAPEGAAPATRSDHQKTPLGAAPKRPHITPTRKIRTQA